MNTFPSSAYGGSNEAHALKGIKCTGFESKISECNISSLEIVSNANGCDKAAVICSGISERIILLCSTILHLIYSKIKI